MSGVAAVDIGSTSCRLLIVAGGVERARRATVTGLAAGLGDGGRLAGDRVAHTLATLEAYRREMMACGVGRVRAVATSGLRRALDGDDFLDRAAAILGCRPEVVDGAEEARLGFIGATQRLDPLQGPFVVVDLGGGSCEFGTAEGGFSAEFGAARLTERWIAHDPPRPEELLGCLSVVEGHLDEVRDALPQLADARTWVGVAGSFTTFAAVDLGLVTYDRAQVNGYRLSREAAEDVYRTLVTEALADRLHNPGLEPARAGVIVGGACAIVKIMRFFALEEIVVSDDDLLDGIVSELSGAQVGQQ